MRSLVCVLLVACAPGPRNDPMQTVDGPLPHVDAAPMLCYAPSVSGTVTPGASSIQSCAIWNNISRMSGGVTLTRDASMLTIAFDSGVTFTGTVVDRDVQLTYWHLHDFSDGCKWRATETLMGDLDPASCVMNLSYRYTETVEISNGACATPCAATGSFSLQVMPIVL